MSKTFELLIKFKGTADVEVNNRPGIWELIPLEKVLTDVIDFGVISNSCFYFIKNDCKNFLPMDNIIYFGLKCDYDGNSL